MPDANSGVPRRELKHNRTSADAEQALRDSEARYQHLFESIDEGFCTIEVLFDTDGRPQDYRFLEANPAFERQTGIVAAVGRTMRAIAPEHEQFWFDIYGRIARSGESIRFEHEATALQRFYEVLAFRIGAPEDNRVAILFKDIRERKRAERSLRESEERQAFLLQLSDAMRPLGDPEQIKTVASEALGRRLGANRVAYAENVEADEVFDIGRNFTGGAEEIRGRYRYADYGQDILSQLRSGQNRVQPDIVNDDRLRETEKRVLLAAGVGASLNVPLVKNGRLVAFLEVNYPTAHDFQPQEIALVVEVAERTWAAVERARVEAAMRESEAKYRTLFESIDEAFCIIEIIEDGHGNAVDCWFVETNEAFERHTGLRGAAGRRGTQVTRPEWLRTYAEVARTGEPKRFERHHESTRRWYDVYATRVGGSDSRRVGLVFSDSTERREREERQVFLLKLSDSLRAQPDERSIKQRTIELLAEHLRLDRCYVSEVFEQEGYSTVGPEEVRPGLPPMTGVYRLADYPETMRQLATQPMVVHDSETDPRFSDAEKAMLALVPQRALLVAALRKGPRAVVWALAASMATPRRWTESERMLLEEVAERTWAAVERARVDAQMHESEEQFRRSIEEAPIPVIMHAEDGEVLQISRTWTELTGYTLEEVPTFDAWLTRAYGPGADSVREHVHALFSGSQRTMSIEFPVRTRVGDVRHWSFSASAPGTLRDGRRFVVGMAVDVTERRRAEAALQQAHDSLEARVRERTAEVQSLFTRLVSAQEEERRRIARDIHDQLGQQMTALRMNLEALRATAAGDPPLEQLERTRRIAQELDASIDFLTWDLRPAALDDLGLPSAIAHLVSGWSERFGIQAQYDTFGIDGTRFTSHVETNLYRLTQEALHNVYKHAKANHVSVLLEQRDGRLVLVVEDDGEGFTPQQGVAAGSFGLTNMRERATLAGGELTIDSTRGQGTTVIVRVPIPGEDGRRDDRTEAPSR